MQLIEYLNANSKILKVLGVTPEEVSSTILEQDTKDSNCMNQTEGLIWVFHCLGKIDEAKKIKAEQ